MFDGRWRQAVDRKTGPVGVRLRRMGVTADVLTGAGLLLSVATALAIGSGHLHLAIILLALTGFADLLDGPVAKVSGTASVRGAFFDSVGDRVSDAIIMGGVAWYLVSVHEGHLVLLPLAVLAVSSFVSYERAKAEALGLSAKGGLMERAERMILLGAGFLTSWLLVPILWTLLGLTLLTATGRFVRVWRVAERPARSPAGEHVRARRRERRAEGTWRTGRVESRWRHWRERREAGEGASGAAQWSQWWSSRQPVGRWRARREEALASRAGRRLRARRLARLERQGAGHGRGGLAPSGGSVRSGWSRRQAGSRWSSGSRRSAGPRSSGSRWSSGARRSGGTERSAGEH